MKKRNINVWVPLVWPTTATWPATQACAVDGNGTADHVFHRPAHNPLSQTSQNYFMNLISSTFPAKAHHRETYTRVEKQRFFSFPGTGRSLGTCIMF